jgi:hypothetical protein
MNLLASLQQMQTRRQFFGRMGLGGAALASLSQGRADDPPRTPRTGTLRTLHHAGRDKRVIYLFMSGGPSHIDLLDYKPRLRDYHGTQLPASIRMGQRITGMTSGQSSFPCVAPMFRFRRHGQCGNWFSELLPNIGSLADDIAVVKSVHTEAINHDPATTFIQTGSQQPGRPALGSWLSYGIGTENANLPTFVVMASQGSGNRTDQPLFSRLWGSGFLPSDHQGVRFRTGADPVLYLSNPPGIDAETRRLMLDGTRELNQIAAQSVGDPEINTRIEQYEMAFRMQSSVPELTDLSSEPRRVLDSYGVDRGYDDGGFARNCLLARRMVERGVRFVQLFHRGWDQHSSLPSQIRAQARDVDQPAAALVRDLKERGLLEDTLVVWGGEFGRTVYSQGQLTATDHGRDHHGRCFSVWMAGAGIKGGLSYGETDDYCYNIVRDPVHIHDLNATILHALGIDHTRLTYRFQGRDYRLTDVHGEVVERLFA